MTFGSRHDQDARPVDSGFSFGLVPTGKAPVVDGEPPLRRTRRRRSGPDRSVLVATGVIVALSIALIAGAGLTALSLVQASEESVKADSAPFCAELATTPGVLSQPAFGWPTEPADLPTTIDAMKAYQERWATMAKNGPPTIREDLRAIATAAGTVITAVEANRSINRPATLAAMDDVTSQTVVRAWAAKYCE